MHDAINGTWENDRVTAGDEEQNDVFLVCIFFY
jgi:hypothetical protein